METEPVLHHDDWEFLWGGKVRLNLRIWENWSAKKKYDHYFWIISKNELFENHRKKKLAEFYCRLKNWYLARKFKLIFCLNFRAKNGQNLMKIPIYIFGAKIQNSFSNVGLKSNSNSNVFFLFFYFSSFWIFAPTMTSKIANQRKGDFFRWLSNFRKVKDELGCNRSLMKLVS